MQVRGSRAWVVVAAEALLDGSAILPDGMERGPRGVMGPVVRVLPLELLFLRRGGLRVPGAGAERRTDTVRQQPRPISGMVYPMPPGGT